MDLTPQVINEVEFSMARKGYDPDQVDEFLEKVAVAIGDLNDRMADLRERVSVAERRAAEAERRAEDQPAERVVAAPQGPSPAAVSAAAEAELETLKRTLLLAQRTADAPVREAEEEARRIIAGAEVEARTAHEGTRRVVLEEIAGLESNRDGLRLEVDALERHIETQRNRLQGAIADLQRILDEPARLQAAPTAVEPPLPLGDTEAAPAAATPAPTPPAAEAPPASEAVRAPVVDPEPPAAAERGTSSFVLAEEDDDDDAWARFSAPDPIDEGPRTEPVLRLDRVERDERGDGGDDAYLAELRKAMLDDTGAPDAADLGYYDDIDGGRGSRSTRFGRRR